MIVKKIKELITYIFDYKVNRVRLRAFADPDTFPLFEEQYKLCLKHSNERLDSEEKVLSRLIIEGHSIEKGLAKSNLRLGFGQRKILYMVELCNLFFDHYQGIPSRLSYAIGILREYDLLHQEKGFSLTDETRHGLDSLYCRFIPSVCPYTENVSKENFFAKSCAPFSEFSSSRHSVRDFSGDPIERSTLQKVFTLAQRAPSACNRQSTRVYCVYNEELRLKIADLQNNAPHGFAERSNPLLVIAFELQDWGTGEQWFGGYLDAGIYIMNLLYSLHYYQIASIPLNWYSDITKNKEIHSLLSIPESQVVVAIVGCGKPVDHFKLVTSLRRQCDEVVKYI